MKRLEHNKQRLQELYDQEAKPKLVGHIEAEVKIDEPECPPQPKPKSIFTTDMEEQLEDVLGEQAAMDARDDRLAKTKEASDLDLESEMERDLDSQTAEGDDEKRRDPADSLQETPDKESTPTTSEDPRDPAQKPVEITTEAEIHEEGYKKQYLTGAQEREARTAARREQQRQKELKEQQEKEAQAAGLAKKAEEEEQGRRIVENALLQEEEERAKQRLAEICRIRKDKKPKKTDKERKRKKPRRDIETEEEEEKDDEDEDPNYDPDKDPEKSFIDDESIIPDDEDIVEMDKHSHVINFKESNEYVRWVRDQLVELEEAAKCGGGVAKRSYEKFLEMLRDGIMQMETYSPIEYSDVKEVMKTIVDPTCVAWRKKLKGVKTGNCRTIMKAEEKKDQVLRAAEHAEIPSDAEGLLGEDSLKGKSPEEQ